MNYILIALLLISSSVSAEVERPKDSQKPYAMMQKLAPLVGTWSMVRERTMDGGKTWETYPATTIQVQYKQKSLMLEEAAVTLENNGFHMSIYISYDQYQQVYRQAAMEDYWGLMDISEGQLDGNTLVFTNTKSRTYYPMEGGRLRALKLRVELKSPSRMIYIDESYDEGNSWSPSFRIQYTLLP